MKWSCNTMVFDLDDTLYPERDYVFSGFDAVDAWLRVKQGRNGFAVQAKARFEQGSRGRIFDEVLPVMGLHPARELIAAMLQAYREHIPQIALYPDAAEALKWADGQFNLALVTDGYAGVQERKIKALGLENRIPCRILTDTIGREFWKPSPEPFSRVMAHFPGPADGYVYVADNPRKDFIGPRQLGWRTIRIRRSGGEHATSAATSAEAADHDITTLTELIPLLEPAAQKI